MHTDPFARPARRRGATLSPERVRRTQRFVSEHLSDHLTTQAMAEAAGLSVWHFIRAYKSATGASPRRFLLGARMHAARKLLATTRLPACEIGYRVGFVSPSHFNAGFKRTCGVTPGHYRKLLRMRAADTG